MFAVEVTSRSADVGGVEWAGRVLGKVLDVDYQGLGFGRRRAAESAEKGRNVGFVRGVGAGGAPVGGMSKGELVVYQEETGCGIAGDRIRHLEVEQIVMQS